ncbi:MAG TPA: SDR family NAD(P)-dependent oxidoreductase [Acidimicrobiia bacterium]|nr:SDR family NAD(P)-dependent oxidoreductase [Acidimicrobiia bacterium]
MHIVTGASRGIGRAVAAELAIRGEPVVAVARSAEPLEALAAGHSGITPVPVDLSTDAGRRILLATLDVVPVASLVHCAASTVPVQAFVSIDPDRLVEDFRIHVAALVALTGLVITERGLDRVAIVDSYSATTPRVGWAGYSVLKAAAQMAAVALQREHPEVRVLRLFPGAVRTGLLEAVLDGPPSPARETYRALETDGAVAAPADVAHWIADALLGPGSSGAMHFRPES